MNIYSLFHKGQLSALCNYTSSLWGSVMPFFLPHLEHSSQVLIYRETTQFNFTFRAELDTQNKQVNKCRFYIVMIMIHVNVTCNNQLL